MKSFVLVEFFKGEGATIYTVLFEDEKITETRKFLNTFSQSHADDVKDIVALIGDAATRRGLSNHHCRPEEGKITDCIIALPGRNKDTEGIIGERSTHPELRLYGLRFTDNTIVLYSGGVKPEGRIPYQDVPVLDKAVKELQQIEKLILDRIKSRPFPEIYYKGNDLAGDLKFEL